MSLKKFLLLTAFALSSQLMIGQNIVKHEVQAGETLTSISKKYNVSIKAIQQRNNLSTENIRAGQVLQIPSSKQSVPSAKPKTQVSRPVSSLSRPSRPNSMAVTAKPLNVEEKVQQITVPPVEIPRCKLTFITDSKTTISAICAKFGISESALKSVNPHLKKEKVKKKTAICIPYTQTEIADIQARAAEEARRKAAEEEARKMEEMAKKKLTNINVALILPFELSKDNKSAEAIKMIDFYEGLLLAVEDFKDEGANINIRVFDEDENPIVTILDSLRTQPCHLIIGAKSSAYINGLREYSKNYRIPLAVPFSSKEDLTVGYPHLFQVNTKASSYYDRVYSAFISENLGNNVVFVDCGTTDDIKYIEGFKTALTNRGIPQSVHTPNELTDLLSHTGGKHTVLIPTSKKTESFKEMVTVLDALDGSISSTVSIFGYPEWLTFSSENTQSLRKYHGSFYTTFYADLTSEDVLKFTRRFKAKFKRDQYNTRPLFGLIGYDVTRFFVGGLHLFGTEFIPYQDRVQMTALQNPLLFERNNYEVNGFINKNIKIIHP